MNMINFIQTKDSVLAVDINIVRSVNEQAYLKTTY